jgi:hypothetical protein
MASELQGMKRLSRDIWLALGLVAVLVITTIVAVFWQTRKAALPALSSASSERDGARALRLWLEQKGFRVSRESEPEYRPPVDADLIFMLEPYYDSDGDHWRMLDEWVEAGGTLFVAGEGWGVDEIFSHYDFGMYDWESGGDATVQTPLLSSPPMDELSHLDFSSVFSTDRDDFIVLLAADNAPVLVTFRQGQGRVILASFTHFLTNAGLKESGNPELVLNLLALAGQSNNIWFDEWHHGEGQRNRIVGPQDWLRYTPAGHAFLFTAVIVFLALLLQGGGFGRPVPLPQSTARRTSLEYITALANLSRRAGHRSEVLRQYHQSLKQHLARRYRLNPALPDDEYVTELAKYYPGLAATDLQNLLKRLRSPHVGEGEMVKLAAETAEWLKKE